MDERDQRMPPFGELAAEFAPDQPGSTGHQDPQRRTVPRRARHAIMIRSGCSQRSHASAIV